MSILPSQAVEHYCLENMLVQPFCKKTLHESGTTFGVSEAGLDIRIAQDITLYPISLKNLALRTIGIKRPSFALASSIEQFRMPNNMMAFVLDKSSLARIGLATQTTCLEPNWRGWLTLELSNHGENVIYLRKGQPIAQVVFHLLDQPTNMGYAGKYQSQGPEPQPAIFSKLPMDEHTWEERSLYD